MSVRWVDDDSGALGAVQWEGDVGQVTARQAQSLTTIEKVSIAGVIISAVSLGVSLWHLYKKGDLL